jgi:hypothetical protein
MPLEIEQKYNNAEAPHIIFVLVDDWGWNDLGVSICFVIGWAFCLNISLVS